MPWQHCGRSILDDEACPTCGVDKTSHTVELGRTRVLAVGRRRLTVEPEAQARTLRAAHAAAVPFCET